MMSNNVVSDNEIINLLNQKINRISCDNKTLETKIKMYKDEKKISQDMVQKLQFEVINLKKQMEMNCSNGCCEDIINQYKQQIFMLNNEINKIKKENYELSQHKNCIFSNNVINTEITLNPNENEINEDCVLNAEQL